jgi:hypothetical protein
MTMQLDCPAAAAVVAAAVVAAAVVAAAAADPVLLVVGQLPLPELAPGSAWLQRLQRQHPLMLLPPVKKLAPALLLLQTPLLPPLPQQLLMLLLRPLLLACLPPWVQLWAAALPLLQLLLWMLVGPLPCASQHLERSAAECRP